MELRPYQTDLLDGALNAYKEGYRAPCIVLPCGGGKSVILAEFARRKTAEGLRVLFLVHRKELCGQIYKTFRRAGVNMALCEVAMVQTVSRQLDDRRKPDYIITDENHHSLAKTYRRIYDYWSDVPRIGVTATPERLNGDGLKDTNDKLVIGVTARWLIEHDYLCDYDYYAPLIDMPKFHIRHGDFMTAEVARFFKSNQQKIYGDVIKQYCRIADGKQAICYLPAVETSKLTAEQFSAAGIAAAHIDGGTPTAERNRIIEQFRKGDIKILCNVDIVSEGFDVPDCECVILLRPTQSLTLYIQQSMRCMRYKEGKRAIIIDHVNNIGRFGFPDKDREWLLEGHPHKHLGGEAPVKICEYCFATVPASTMTCPQCGHEFPVKNNAKEKVEIDLLKLDKDSAEIRVRSYLSPNECETVDELVAYAKIHHYKPGWVWHQQKRRGWLGGSKNGNKNTKRYPCRAITDWNSTT